jgi:LPXTG-motif cell wall-anchored protein
MSDLDALPHGIVGLRSSLEETSSFPYILVVLLVLAIAIGLFWFFRRKKKNKGSGLQEIRAEIEALSLEDPFAATFSSKLKEGLLLKYGVDLLSLGAKDMGQVIASKKVEVTSLAMPGQQAPGSSLPFDGRDLEDVFSRIEQDLYAGFTLTVAEKARFRDLAMDWLKEGGT